MRYKAEKSSEEKDLKFKQKKLSKKLKQVEERESKLKTLKDKLNRKEVTETDDCNNNDDVQSLNRHSLTTNSSMITTTVSYNFPMEMDSKSFPSMVFHWLPLHMNKLDPTINKGSTGILDSNNPNSTPDCVNPTTSTQQPGLNEELELLKELVEKLDKKFDDVNMKCCEIKMKEA